jgi:hexosaminidase
VSQTPNIRAALLFSLLMFGANAVAAPHPGNDVAVIPRPARAEWRSGFYMITRSTRVSAAGVSAATISQLENRFRSAGGFALRRATRGNDAGEGIRLYVDTARFRSPEAYTLLVDSSGVTITGGGQPGVFYGVQSLFQLCPPSLFGAAPAEATGWPVPCCVIADSPRFAWRGMQIDVSRHFFPVPFIKTFIDILAMHKLNVFHWHLTDDQGWRIEIKRYPALTAIGGWRVDRENQPWTNRTPQQAGERATYGGFYSQEEIRDIVRYASERCVTIVPEIEMPAHALAALAAYPAFSCTGGPFTVPPGFYWPVSTIYCAGNDSTFAFLEEVLSEVMELFPGKYIHIGGDEADKTEWRKCPKCQARIRAEGLRDESELQSYFVKRIDAFIRSRGRRLIGWDEILEGGLPSSATVMSWRGMEGGIEAARAGHDVVMTPEPYTYLNEYQGPPALEPLAWGGSIPLSRVYGFEPLPDSLAPGVSAHILGGEGCLWSEYISTPTEAFYMLLPRLAGLSEVFWSPLPRRDWGDFARRIKLMMERYTTAGIAFARSAYWARVTVSADTVLHAARIALTTELPPDSIIYTTDGSAPEPGSSVYTGPITVRSSLTLRASPVVHGRVYPPSSESFEFHTALFKSVRVATPATKYTAGGTGSLTDGLSGSLDHGDGRWLGFEGVDFEGVVDLDSATSVSSLGARFLQKTGSWVFFPTRVTFELSGDGVHYETVGSFDIPIAASQEEPRAKKWECSFQARQARFVKVIARNVGTCPAWHPGAGGKAWLFIDEIIVH